MIEYIYSVVKFFHPPPQIRKYSSSRVTKKEKSTREGGLGIISLFLALH